MVKQVSSDVSERGGKVAASVTVIKENAGKPEVVKSESDVALSFLPPPSDAEVALARQRSSKSDQQEYEQVKEYGKKLLLKINADLSKMESDQQEAKRVSVIKDQRIAELEQKCLDIASDSDRKLWTIVGMALTVLGGVIWWALKDVKGAATLIVLGLCFGAYPRIMDSKWFMVIAGLTLSICCCLGLWWLYDKVRDSVNAQE